MYKEVFIAVAASVCVSPACQLVFLCFFNTQQDCVAVSATFAAIHIALRANIVNYPHATREKLHFKCQMIVPG